MRSNNIFHLFEAAIKRSSASAFSSAPAILPLTSFHKVPIYNAQVGCSLGDENSSSGSRDQEWIDEQVSSGLPSPVTPVENEGDFSFIKTDYAVS